MPPVTASLNGDEPQLEPPLRVLIADSVDGIDREIRTRLRRDVRFIVCAYATNAADAVEAVLRTQPHIALLGVDLPGGGISAAREMLARRPQLTVVMFSDDDAQLFPALRVGVDGYLLRDMNLDRLPETLWDAEMGGAAALPRALFRQILARFRDTTALRRSVVTVDGRPLTSREWQILSLLRAGISSTQIAQRLSISVATVRSHRRHIRRKLASDAS